MNKSVSFLLVAMVAISACASGENWKEKMGLPNDCNNPVFTKPYRISSHNRVQGAGINMNDGEAYTSCYVPFGSDWHYAPKLPLSEQEKNQISQVMGLFLSEDELNLIDSNSLLKFSAKAVNGCYAVVVYRAFRNYRYSNVEHENLEQFIAVYDDNGNLTDAMMMGYVDDICDILLVEPHKQYSVPFNMGDHKMEYSEKNSNHFTISRYWHLKDTPKGEPNKVEMKRYYTITPTGKIKLEKVTNNSENYDKSKSLEAGVLIENVANAQAVNLMELMLTPMSDNAGTFTRLEKACAQLLSNPVVGDKVMHLGMMIYNRDPKAFLTYVYENRTKTSLLKLLKKAKSYQGQGRHYDYNLEQTLGNACTTATMRKWFKTKL
ncbi:MAG: hypothetical protein II559_06230 [Muribaculaceae bacterium]|nr:hypothetical protein [Muribaculaceae bacterium]MBQ5409827.1 hypothetical protein [Muribaculaceae bacterium]MDY6294233.1 hypothetical protein [Bacteroidales bacterium]